MDRGSGLNVEAFRIRIYPGFDIRKHGCWEHVLRVRVLQDSSFGLAVRQYGFDVHVPITPDKQDAANMHGFLF